MYSIGQRVVYSSSGVCTVADIRPESFTGEQKEYYVLEPVFGTSSFIFVPLDNEKLLSRMRPLMTREQIFDLIRAIPDEETEWIPENRIRAQAFQQILLDGEPRALLRMTKMIHRRKGELARRGKKNLMADETVFKRAEKILCGEIASVLGITPDEVHPLIVGELVK